jgi:hypothetical protein
MGRIQKNRDPGPGPIVCENITDETSEFSVNGPAEVLRHGEKF